LNPKEPDKGPPSALRSPEKNSPSTASTRRLRILLAEDNKADVYLVRQALAQHWINADLIVHRDGEEMVNAIERIEAGEPCPDLVLLDLNLPKRNGEFLLARLRQSSACAHLPIVIVTSSGLPKDREAAVRLGASNYFCKPSDYDDFMQLGALIKDMIQPKEPVQ
jgi:two-component system, chemotaxis family, response regulator Rcp1